MEIIEIIIWVLNILLSDNEITENDDLEFENFSSIWTVPSLQQLMYQQIKKFPQYEKNLSAAFNCQMKLIRGIENGCSASIEKAKKLIKVKIEDCKSSKSLELLKQQVEWLLERIPELSDLFESHKSKLNLINDKNQI